MQKHKVLQCYANEAQQALLCNAEAAVATLKCRSSRRYNVMQK
jgi:hypothetical protein